MSQSPHTSLSNAYAHDRDGDSSHRHEADTTVMAAGVASAELLRSLAEVKGQAQFVLYLADQIEESLQQLSQAPDASHGAFLCKVLGMYSGQLESKHQGLGDKIAETCQEVYVTVREFDAV
ncbi:MAG: hypothetical protein P4L84_12220 [Isosphaeraceae bacterium]|nr:hypothetical protein [Isosphaeraceae bacterium]